MLSSAETIDVIAETLKAHKLPPIILDPVMGNLPGHLFSLCS
jgi:hydroxymethylpyrimidine/phosphomethylpyrimidine kinase